MPSANEVVQIGPFTGGLNTYSDPTAVLDNELVQVENFELDLDGSLVSRPPFTQGPSFPLGTSGNLNILGYYYAPDGTPYLIGSDGLTSTYFFTGTSWTLITNTVAAAAMTQYQDLAWLQAPLTSTNPGGSWSPTAGFTAVAAIPKGNVIIAHKSRLWASSGLEAGAGQNGTRIYLSTVADPKVWNGDFVTIGSGDGQNIVKMMIYFNDLLVFKRSSIYRFSYSTDPSTGQPSRLSQDIGIAGRDAAVNVEGVVYFAYDDRVYTLANYQLTQINQKVPLEAGTMSNNYLPVTVSQFNNRLIVSYYDTMYVYDLRIQRWTTWKSSQYGAIGRIIQLETNSVVETAIAHSSVPVPTGGTRTAQTLLITDAFSPNASENMVCSVQTKNYNYEAPSLFKRLFYWGADVSFRGSLSAYASAIQLHTSPTWDQLLLKTWGDMLSYKWDNVGAGDANVYLSQIDTTNSESMRKFVKLGRSFRFRQVYFRLVFNTNGTSTQSPVRLFSIMTRVNTKQTVVDQVS